MQPKTLIIVIVGLIAVIIAGIGLFRPASGGGGIVNVGPAEVKSAIQGGAQVVDVRTAGEFQMGHIPGALNVPVDQVGARAAAWDREKTYVVYCATGSRSATAVEEMRALGFKNIKHFSAGIQAWDGELETGAASNSQQIETAGKPVLIEFYTDS